MKPYRLKRELTLYTDKPEFAGVVFDRKGRQIVFQRFAQTEMENITWISLLIFRLGWPPVVRIRAFTNNDREIESGGQS